MAEIHGLSEEEGYWSSEDGIYTRLGMLGETVVWDYFNKAVKVTADAFGIKKLQIVGPGPGYPGVCEYCERLFDEGGEGRVYEIYWFLPDLPAHVGCRHFWDVFLG